MTTQVLLKPKHFEIGDLVTNTIGDKWTILILSIGSVSYSNGTFLETFKALDIKQKRISIWIFYEDQEYLVIKGNKVP